MRQQDGPLIRSLDAFGDHLHAISPANSWKFQLFVRQDRDAAYVAVGPVQLVSHEGDRPISITWRLDKPLTAELFRKFSVLRG